MEPAVPIAHCTAISFSISFCTDVKSNPEVITLETDDTVCSMLYFPPSTCMCFLDVTAVLYCSACVLWRWHEQVALVYCVLVSPSRIPRPQCFLSDISTALPMKTLQKPCFGSQPLPSVDLGMLFFSGIHGVIMFILLLMCIVLFVKFPSGMRLPF